MTVPCSCWIDLTVLPLADQKALLSRCGFSVGGLGSPKVTPEETTP